MRSKPYEMHREELEPLFDVMDAIAKAHDGTIAQEIARLQMTQPRPTD